MGERRRSEEGPCRNNHLQNKERTKISDPQASVTAPGEFAGEQRQRPGNLGLNLEAGLEKSRQGFLPAVPPKRFFPGSPWPRGGCCRGKAGGNVPTQRRAISSAECGWEAGQGGGDLQGPRSLSFAVVITQGDSGVVDGDQDLGLAGCFTSHQV